jgi:AcrR family transcriptional regulator
VSTINSSAFEELGSAAQRDRRRRIIDATVALASKGGFDAVQMRAVAERAHVALGTLYRYFPSKIHLLVCALARELERANDNLDRRPVPGETTADRVMSVLGRTTRALQRDPNLTEALTRAFMFADSSVASEIHVVGSQVTRMLMRAMYGQEPDDHDVEPDADDLAIAKVIGDVWLASLVQWVTGRATAADVGRSLDVAVRLLLRD